jgi:hypothetical protein
MRLGDEVRRRARGAAGIPPTARDVAVLEELIARLEEAITGARARPEMIELERVIAAVDLEQSARLAARLYSELVLVAPPEHVFSSIPLRRHSRDLGEVLPDPAALAEEIRSLLSAGIIANHAAGEMPEPIVLAASWEAAGGELALRLRGTDLGAVVPRHEPSGDLWCFAPVLRGPFTICIAQRAEDEWWAASPIPFERYAQRVAALLTAAGVACERIG